VAGLHIKLSYSTRDYGWRWLNAAHLMRIVVMVSVGGALKLNIEAERGYEPQPALS
jgi:hypothetical protein